MTYFYVIFVRLDWNKEVELAAERTRSAAATRGGDGLFAGDATAGGAASGDPDALTLTETGPSVATPAAEMEPVSAAERERIAAASASAAVVTANGAGGTGRDKRFTITDDL